MASFLKDENDYLKFDCLGQSRLPHYTYSTLKLPVDRLARAGCYEIGS